MEEGVESGYLLLSLKGPTRGGPWTVPSLHTMWNDHVAKLPGLQDANPHLLRHTFASDLADAKVPRLVISELLGHEDPRSTDIYTHVEAEALQRSATRLQQWREQTMTGAAV